jgi:uncharacterized protein (DUF427 family)
MSDLPACISSARGHRHWRGQARPPFATEPAAGQVSVWDFPRPPRLAQDSLEAVVRWGAREVARTRRAVFGLKTAHPPGFYLPWDDVARDLPRPAAGSSSGEWKGAAQYWSLVDGDDRIDTVAWSDPRPMAGAEALSSCAAFHAGGLACSVGGRRSGPSPAASMAEGSHTSPSVPSRASLEATPGSAPRRRDPTAACCRAAAESVHRRTHRLNGTRAAGAGDRSRPAVPSPGPRPTGPDPDREPAAPPCGPAAGRRH